MLTVTFCAANILFNLLNTINSRAKQVVVANWRYNFFSTVAASSAYLCTIGLAARFMLEVRSNQMWPFVLLVVLYGLSSGVGAVAGQIVAVNLEKKGHFTR
jgi:hypothetical protein